MAIPKKKVTPKRVPKKVNVTSKGKIVDTVEINHDPRFEDGITPVPKNVSPAPGNVIIGITNGVRYGVPGTYSSVNVDLTIHRSVEDDEDVIRDEFTYWSGQLQKEIDNQVNQLIEFFEE